jgi:hypothetical protein
VKKIGDKKNENVMTIYKMHFRFISKQLIISIVFFVLIIVIISYYNLHNFGESILYAIIGSLISIYFGFLKLFVDYDKVFRELYVSFNEKYSKNFNDLLEKLRANDEKEILTLADKNIIIDYFNLCSEEYLWFKKRRIPNNVWNAWVSGIIENIRIPKVWNVFKEETNTDSQRISYYGFAEYIEKKIREKRNNSV